MKNYLLLLIALVTVFTSCIKDDLIEDLVEPSIRITTVLDSIKIATSYQFEFKYLDNVGQEQDVTATWASSNVSILEIDNNGLATAIAYGEADISVSYSNGNIQVKETITVNVGDSTVESISDKSGTIQTTSSYILEGSFTLNEDGDNLILAFADDYKASSTLPGLFVYLTNNRNSDTDAFEISAVQTFNGAHSYIIEGVGINDYKFLLYYCKPFGVKVGDGEIK